MNKTLITLAVAGMMMMFSAGSALAHDDGGALGNMYRASDKETHMKSFPQGHPVTNNPVNRCMWDEKENLFFCQYPTGSFK